MNVNFLNFCVNFVVDCSHSISCSSVSNVYSMQVDDVCLPDYMLCDGNFDCFNGEDELNCTCDG